MHTRKQCVLHHQLLHLNPCIVVAIDDYSTHMIWPVANCDIRFYTKISSSEGCSAHMAWSASEPNCDIRFYIRISGSEHMVCSVEL